MEKIKKRIGRIKDGHVKLKKEIKEKTVGYILAAFGFVAGLAWNEAIKSLIDRFLPNSSNGVFVKFIYAFIVTIIIVLISIYLIRTEEKT